MSCIPDLPWLSLSRKDAHNLMSPDHHAWTCKSETVPTLKQPKTLQIILPRTASLNWKSITQQSRGIQPTVCGADICDFQFHPFQPVGVSFCYCNASQDPGHNSLVLSRPPCRVGEREHVLSFFEHGCPLFKDAFHLSFAPHTASGLVD